MSFQTQNFLGISKAVVLETNRNSSRTMKENEKRERERERAISLVWRRSMADHARQPESLVDKIFEKIPDHLDSLSSSSESKSDDKFNPFGFAKAKVYRLFSKEKPFHKVLGSGKRNLSLFDLFV